MSTENADQHSSNGNTYTIIVNGRSRTTSDGELSYTQVVQLAYPGVLNDGTILYTVSYANPHGRDGTLAEGQEVKVKDGMSFNVGKTNRS